MPPERLLDRLRDGPLIAVLVAVLAALWAFAELADEVMEGTTRTVDETILLWFRTDDLTDPIGPRWVEEMMRDFTSLGGFTVLSVVALAAVGYALLSRHRRLAVALVVAVAGGSLISNLIKAVIGRTRPDLVPHGVHVVSASFPSGHATMAATVYFTLAALLMRFHERRATRIYILVVAAVLTFIVGVSRVYLGVHWPTDVLAGWTIGAAWGLVVWVVADRLRQPGRPLDQP